MKNNTDPTRCPFCGTIEDNCEHLLLLVDKTFRTALGGELFDAFNKRWSEICNEHEEEIENDDFPENEYFNEILETINYLSDYSVDYEFEGGPGNSTDNVIYFVKNEDSLKMAIEKFDLSADI